MKKKHIVVIGGGFGGMAVVHRLRNAPVEITLIDRQNHHLFQPLLYQVAVGALSPADIATPFRFILKNQKNVDMILDEVTGIDRGLKKIELKNGQNIQYDSLIIATGNHPSYFGHNEWQNYAPGLKQIIDALQIRDRLFMAFEKASRLLLPADRKAYLTFVVVGGGPTGVELAGSICEIDVKTMQTDFRNLGPDEIKVILIEAGPRLLPSFHHTLSQNAQESLQKIGVEVLVDTKVVSMSETEIATSRQSIQTRNIIWAAGNEASSLVKTLDTPTDRSGRVLVESDLSLPNDPYVFVIGDAAACIDVNHPEKKEYLPGVAQVAMQQGRYVANISMLNVVKEKRRPFKYKDLGIMATIGRSRAVGEIFGMRFTGFIAWFLWSVIHVMSLVSSRNRFRVFTEWFWYYITFQPGARLIYRSFRNAPIQK